MPDVICTSCGTVANGHWRELRTGGQLCSRCGDLAGVARAFFWAWVPAEVDRDLSIVPALPIAAPAPSASRAPEAAAPGGQLTIDAIATFAAKRHGELRAYVNRAGSMRERAIARKEAELFEGIVKLISIVRRDPDLARSVAERLAGE